MHYPRYIQFLLVLGGFLVSLLTAPLSAQNGVERIVIVNGGQFNNPNENVNVMLYDPVSGNSTVIDTIQTGSVQEVLLEGSTAYVAAQDSIVKYDLSTGQRLAAAAFGAPSTAKLGIYHNYLLAGNWYGLTGGNLRIFNKDDLSFVDSIPQLSKGARDFVIVGDTAYVVQNFNNQFFGDSAGYISVVDLKRMRFVRDIALDPRDELGRLVHVQGRLYGLNPNAETIEVYDIGTGQVLPKRFTGVDMQTDPTGARLLIHHDLLYTKINNGIGVYDLVNNRVIDTTLIDTFATAFALDTINDLFYLTQTDFFSYMRGGIFNGTGSKAGAFSTGFAPEAIGIVYNDLPVANNDGGFTPSNQSILLDVLANDEDDGSLTVDLGSNPQHGRVSISGNQLLFEPDAGFTGFDRFTYQAIDGWGHRDTAEVQVQIGSTTSPQGPGDYGLERVIFSTGGAFLAGGNEVTAYSYNPEKRQLKAFDKIVGDFSNAVAVDKHYAYVHVGRSDFSPYGKDQIIKYRMDEETAVDTAFEVSGTHQILIFEEYMVLTRSFGADSNYVLMYHIDRLASGPVFTDVNIPVQPAGAVMVGKDLYVAYNQGDTASLAVFTLNPSGAFYNRTITLDTLAAPLGELYTDGEHIIGLSEKVLFPPPTFSPVVVRAGVTIVDPANDTWQTTSTPEASGGVGVFGDSLYANFGSGIGIFNLQTLGVDQNPVFPLDYTAAARDPRTGSFFFLQTDYFSFGQLGSSDSIGEFRFDLPTDISGEAIALAYNHAPVANDDYDLSIGIPVTTDVLLNDLDADADPLTVSILEQPQFGTASVIGNEILYNSPFSNFDSLVYVATDPWGRSDQATVYYGPIENIAEELGLGAIQLFPNPVQDNVFIRFEKTPFYQLELTVFDMQGKKVIESQFQQIQQIQLGVTHLSAGSYQVLLKYEDKVWATRFIKQ